MRRTTCLVERFVSLLYLTYTQRNPDKTSNRSLWLFLCRFWWCFQNPEMSWVVRRPSQVAWSEVRLLLALMPLCQCTFKASIDPCVTASDASEIGLSVSRSVRLSPAGETFARARRQSFGANAAVLPSLPGEKAGPRLFMVILSDGIGGMRRAAERLSLPV